MEGGVDELCGVRDEVLCCLEVVLVQRVSCEGGVLSRDSERRNIRNVGGIPDMMRKDCLQW